MTEALATRNVSAISTAEQVALVKRTIMPAGSSDDELKLFVGQCNRTGLDPFSRQIYALKMGGRISTMVGIDGFRIIAERSGVYAGQRGPWWCGDDGKWVDVWVDGKPPLAARVGVMRSDFAEPLYAVARLSSYSTGQNLWKKMPELMIAKVAEALALRRAFPHDLSGLYTADEMDQAAPPAAKPRAPRRTAPKPAPAPAGMPKDAPAAGEPDCVLLVDHIITDVSHKDGETNGKPWTMCRAKTMDGSEFVTFDADYSAMLQQALEQKRPVRIISELAAGKKTPKITDMTWAQDPPKNANEAAQRMIEPLDNAPSEADITW